MRWGIISPRGGTGFGSPCRISSRFRSVWEHSGRSSRCPHCSRTVGSSSTSAWRGPLAGLAVAIPALLIGLQWSTIVTGEPDPQAAMQGASLKSSVLLALLARLAMGEAVSQGHALLLHPLAFAGWLGLMITALNLIPVGQLDGGHVAYALLGRARAERLAKLSLFALVLLGIFVWPGLFYWAIIVYFLAGVRGLPPLDDVTPMTPIRWGIGLLALALLLLILFPVPHNFAKTIGLHCPYV